MKDIRPTRRIAMAIAVLAMTPVVTLTAQVDPAHADGNCRGTNSSSKFYQDPRGGGEGYQISLDSCAVERLQQSSQDDVNGITAASGIGGFFYKLLAIPGLVINGQHQVNKRTLEQCASSGTGVSYQQINGWIRNCHPQ